MSKFIRVPFASEGDKREIPDQIQTSGAVSMTTGYGFDYERNPETDPYARDVERPEMNYMFNLVTSILQQLQIYGCWPYITDDQNGGEPYPYPRAARCLYDAGSGVAIYESLADNNTSLPTDAARWRLVDLSDLVPVTRQVKTASPLSGGGALTTDLTLSLIAGTEGDTLIYRNKAWTPAKTASAYELCEFYYFRHPTLKAGFQAAQGGLLANAKTLYPEAWEYLVNGNGKTLCKTEAEWQTLSKATFATPSAGSAITWNGVGGVPWFAPNTSTGALRLPDIRGMYMEASGFDSLGVGGVHGDGVRNMTAMVEIGDLASVSGAFTATKEGKSNHATGSNATWSYGKATFTASRVIPTLNANKPRAWGALPCVYLGS